MPRFLMLVVTKAEVEDGVYKGSPEMFEQMGIFNKKMADAGVLLAVEGLEPTRDESYRFTFTSSGVQVASGPFDLSKEDHVSGYWIIKTKDAQEAVDWAKQVPFPEPGLGDGQVLLRKIAGSSDEPEESSKPMSEVQKKMDENAKRR